MKGIGAVMADLSGPVLLAEEREALRHPLVGGVILFARNFTDAGQLRVLCRQLTALKSPRLLIAVDHEGGRVQRFRLGFSRVPAMRSLGARYVENRRSGVAQARRWGRCIGRELSAFGIDLSFAPVLDRDTGRSRVIGDRAFSSAVSDIVPLARAFCRGLAAEGHAATGKHFPGHGAVAADSHQTLPVDRRTLEAMEASDLIPFRAMIDEGIGSLMTAHVRYPAVDDRPASLSRRWVHTLLRRRYAFDGAVLTDDLSMGGAAGEGSMPDRVHLALEAGSDMVLVCNDPHGLQAVLDEVRPVGRGAADRRLRRLYHQPRT